MIVKAKQSIVNLAYLKARKKKRSKWFEFIKKKTDQIHNNILLAAWQLLL